MNPDPDVETRVLARFKAHTAASLDDLLDSLPNDEIRAVLAAFGRKAVRITQGVLAKRAKGNEA